MVPPGGWHFKDGDVYLTGHSLDHLYDVVRDFRAENHLPLNDVVGDVNAFLCGNAPKYCHGVTTVQITSVSPPTRESELLNDIVVWCKNLITSNQPLQFVIEELAEARAQTCRACPKNVNWRGGCGSCVSAADRLSASVRQAKETKSSRVLGGCAIMRHDNRAAIFLDKNHFFKPTQLPANCWLNE